MSDILYLCDHKACESCTPWICDYTTDISHARNFVKLFPNHRGEEFYREEPPEYAENQNLSDFRIDQEKLALVSDIPLEDLRHIKQRYRTGDLYDSLGRALFQNTTGVTIL